MRFEWDESKNRLNIAKHGLDFTDGKEVFRSPMLTVTDNRHDYGEPRYIGLGSLRNIVVVVVFTEPEKNLI